MSLGPRAFLKKLGFVFDKKPTAIDNALRKALDDEGQNALHSAFTNIHIYNASTNILYQIPKTQQQAALLFSHDSSRIVYSLTWVNKVIKRLDPSSIIEFGCGAGFQLQYINHCFPDVALVGIDKSINLLNTIPERTNIQTSALDYFEYSSDEKYDLVLCDFGWDNSDIPSGPTPHNTETIYGKAICPGCAETAQQFYVQMLSTFVQNVSEIGSLAITGRFPAPQNQVAFYRAVESLNLSIKKDLSTLLKVPVGKDKVDRLHAFVLTNNDQNSHGLSLEDILNW